MNHMINQMTLAQEWEVVKLRIRTNIGEDRFQNWFGRVQIAMTLSSDDAVHLTVPTRFLERWIQEQYLNLIHKFWVEICGHQVDVVISTRSLTGNQTKRTPAVDPPVVIATVPSVLDILVHWDRSKDIKLRDILNMVCRYYNISEMDILARGTAQGKVLPIQIGVYLARELTGKTFADIGKSFGGRERSTILHSVRKVTERLISRPNDWVAQDIQFFEWVFTR